DDGPLLSHETGHVAAIAGHQHHSALHRYAESRRRILVDDHRSSANGGGRPVPCVAAHNHLAAHHGFCQAPSGAAGNSEAGTVDQARAVIADTDRKSTRLNSSHVSISYAVFCLKKKKVL